MLQSASASLFTPHGHDRVDARRPASRKQCRKQGDGSEDDGDDGQRHEIASSHSLHQRPDQVAERKRSREAKNDRKCKLLRPAYEHAHDVPPVRAERHPDADLLRALSDAVRRDREDSHRREHESDRREPSEPRAEHSRRKSSSRLRLVQRFDREERQRWIHRAHLFTQRRTRSRELAFDDDRGSSVRRGFGLERRVYERAQL
jgi:hypothetical protein